MRPDSRDERDRRLNRALRDLRDTRASLANRECRGVNCLDLLMGVHRTHSLAAIANIREPPVQHQ